MKAIVCEMCSSNNVVKDGDFFVCQNCGTKYTVEAAKKLLIEGTVDVSGSTVAIDNTGDIERGLENARRALQKGDWEEVEKYYNKVEELAPKNIEAVFFSSYAKVRMNMTENDEYKRKNALSIFSKSISIIDDCYDVKDTNENQRVIQMISNYISALFSAPFSYNSTTGISYVDKQAMVLNLRRCEREFVSSLVKIANIDEKKIYYELLIKHCNHLLPNTYDGASVESIRDQAITRLKKLDPNAQIQLSEGEKQSSGCYVATAVYGSYDCPQVWTLRRYRDYTLAETWYGRAFIHFYYTVSPTLVKWFGHTNWFKNMWRGKLDRMVMKLNDEGVENTPYQDRKW